MAVHIRANCLIYGYKVGTIGLSYLHYFYRILGGELFDRVIDDDFILTERACVVFMRQICEGVEYMHLQNIIHLDMKVEYELTKSSN